MIVLFIKIMSITNFKCFLNLFITIPFHYLMISQIILSNSPSTHSLNNTCPNSKQIFQYIIFIPELNFSTPLIK